LNVKRNLLVHAGYFADLPPNVIYLICIIFAPEASVRLSGGFRASAVMVSVVGITGRAGCQITVIFTGYYFIIFYLFCCF